MFGAIFDTGALLVVMHKVLVHSAPPERHTSGSANTTRLEASAVLDDVRRRAAGDEATPITRTAAVTAAPRVAIKYGAATLMIETSPDGRLN